MKRSILVFSILVLVLSFCFALPLLSNEKKGQAESYRIKQGDTLWDISARFLKDPFLWPKLWQRNPYITNPHWIYPGNSIRLTAGEEEKKEEPPRPAAIEKPKVQEPQVKTAEAPPVEKKPEPPPVKPAEEKPNFFYDLRTSGFLSDVDYYGSGTILESREGKTLMAEGDIVYLAFRGAGPVEVGNKYTIFRASDIVFHPHTGEKVGRRYRPAGILQVIDQHRGFGTAKVIEAFEAIFKGDMIQPYLKEKMEVGELKK